MRSFPTLPRLVRTALLIIHFSLFSPFSFAEISTDGSLGNAQSLIGPDYQITDDLGRYAGNNLFHSFQDFNLAPAETARFSGLPQTRHIFSRITGGSVSQINGKIQVDMPQADLYLLNPAGFIFGESAQLDVPAGFYSSTASEVQFSDGTQWQTDTSTSSHLSSQPASAFGFLNNATQTQFIHIDGSRLALKSGQNLHLSAPNISINNSLVDVPAGQIEIRAVKQADSMAIAPKDAPVLTQAGQLTLHDSQIRSRQGFIQLQAADIVMHDSQINARNNTDKTPPRVDIDANTLLMEAGSSIDVDNLEEGRGGGNIEINLTASLQLLGEQTDQRTAIVANNRSTDVDSQAGEISIRAGNILLEDGAVIAAGSQKAGKGGFVSIEATGDVRLLGENATEDRFASSVIGAYSFGEGDAGKVFLTANNLELRDGGRISTLNSASGLGGEQDIIVANTINISGQNHLQDRSGILADSRDAANAGQITLQAGHLNLSQGGVISASAENGQGGDIRLTVTDNVQLSGEAVTDQAEFKSSYIGAFSRGSGQAGTIKLTAKNLALYDGSILGTLSFGSGNGNLIALDIANNLILEGANSVGERSGILTDSTRSIQGGNAGDVDIQAQQLILKDGARISASTRNGLGGNINVQATDVQLSGENPHDQGEFDDMDS